MNIAIILAGGIGNRMRREDIVIPKQFLKIDNKPIVAYTLANFQNHDSIDKILVVCVDDWIEEMKKIVVENHFDKVSWIISGGKSGHESSLKALLFLENKIKKSDYVIFHDAVRPILPKEIIDNMVFVANKFGNACVALPMNETIIITNDHIKGNSEIDRGKVMRVQTPQMYKFKDILDCYKKSLLDQKEFIYANTCAIYYGLCIYFSKGFAFNIKITTPDDLILFSPLIRANNKELLK